MDKTQQTKARFLEGMAAYVLEHGLNTASLRPLARAAGTSDRMLIYHFTSKDQLVAELLQYLSDDMAEKLDLALPPKRAETMQQCMEHILVLLRTEEFGRYLRLWLDILAQAGQGHADHKETGKKMIDSYLSWLKNHVPLDTPDPDKTVSLMLTLIDGIIVLDTLEKGDVADLAVKSLFDGTITGSNK